MQLFRCLFRLRHSRKEVMRYALGFIVIPLALIAFLNVATSKEIKDLTQQERGHLAVIGSLSCLSEANAQELANFQKDQNNAILEKMEAFFNLMKSNKGMSAACNMLYVDDLIEKPLSLMNAR